MMIKQQISYLKMFWFYDFKYDDMTKYETVFGQDINKVLR